ncbi:MAG: hypothetical protein ACOX4M_00710 [Acetivibrionales bacterium]
MRNRAIYNAFAVKYDGLDTNPYFTAVAGSGARAGEYTIKNIVTATTAKVERNGRDRGNHRQCPDNRGNKRNKQRSK